MHTLGRNPPASDVSLPLSSARSLNREFLGIYQMDMRSRCGTRPRDMADRWRRVRAQVSVETSSGLVDHRGDCPVDIAETIHPMSTMWHAAG
jgi:hypothetical protein